MNNIIINNRYFNDSINYFFNKNNLNSKNIYCDIDSLNQYPNYQKCNIINQIQNYNIFGDKYTHYYLLMKNNKKSKYLLETYLFDINNIQKIKNKINKYSIWIIKPRNDYGRKGVNIIRNYNDIYKWIQKEKSQQWILQKYIDNPLLLNKKKFHIRIYVIINKKNKKINFFVYKKGFIYTAGKKYNKYSNDLNSHLSGEDNPNRVSLFDTKHPLYNIIWKQIKDLILKCIVPIYPYVKCPNINDHCYKFLGIDILIDQKYNLYLAEINSRLISLKYPTKNFKNELYLDILNTIYFNKTKMMELVYTNQNNTIIENFKNQKFNIIVIYIIIIFIIIIITKIIFHHITK